MALAMSPGDHLTPSAGLFGFDQYNSSTITMVHVLNVFCLQSIVQGVSSAMAYHNTEKGAE